MYDDELLTGEPTLEEVEGKQVNVYSINPDAVWSDGTPITADDFEFTWRLQRSADPADGGCESLLSTVGFERIESVDGADEGKTVTVTYGSAFADWQGLFTGTTPLLPAHLLDNDDPVALCEMITTGWPTDQGIPEDISGGPWQLKLENIDVSSQVVTLTPNENYWGEKPGLAALVYQNIGNDPGAAGAKALLEESGYVLGGDGVYEHPDRGRLALAISTTVNNPLRQQTIDVIIPQASATRSTPCSGRTTTRSRSTRSRPSWPTPQPCRGSRTTPPSPVHCGTARGGRSAELPGRTSRRDPHHPAVRPP
ncbi:MAG: hypothetical protein H0T40_02625 [Geodermatophilaceae bacterium]|nr:hypothetical protein [Geodermatophilaceae bacterium]